MTDQTSVAILRRVADETAAVVEPASATEAALLDTLARHVARLDTATFQLAVLGQFKRGKSTLINALIGRRLLATDVLPATAIPTFLVAGDGYGIATLARDGARSCQAAHDLDALAELAAAVTTETKNPRNTLALDRVRLTLPAKGMLDWLVLVDTPGIGSTHRHNTEAAHGVLPECDAALFVLSVDPPITEAELDYLAAACGAVGTVILVMNKIDVVREDELARIVSFVADVVSRRSDLRLQPEIFSLSARTGLEGRLAEDEGALARSGLATLEAHLRDHLVARKQSLLVESIGRKMLAVLNLLSAEGALRRKALLLPRDSLDFKIEAMQRAESDFERERERLGDSLQGEWRRSSAKLEELCVEADKSVSNAIAALSAETFGAVDELETRVQALFDAVFTDVVDAVAAQVTSAVASHQSRYDDLVSHVRAMAASIMELPSTPPIATEPSIAVRKPYWSGRVEIDSLGSLTMDGLSHLLPRSMRARRRIRKRRAAIARALTKNLISLHWSAKQSIDDTFRQLLIEMTSSVEASLLSTSEVLFTARARRLDADDSTSREAVVLDERNKKLEDLAEGVATILARAKEATPDRSAA